MTGTVIAIYQSASAAEMVLGDLEAAKVPSAVIKRVVQVPVDDPHRHIASGVAVTVDDMHVSVIKQIMDMHAPVAMQERSAPLN